MQWTHPQALLLVLPVALAWLGLALYGRAKRRRAAEAFVARAMLPRILPAESGERFWLKTALWAAALVLGVVAIGGPRFGEQYVPVKPRGADLYVMIDVSKSMLATDVPPTRLARAKADVADLLQRLHGERIGLIAFAGTAVVKCPLTTDYNYFRTVLEELDPTAVSKGGTAIGDAIRKALSIMPQDASRDQALLIITDGEDHESSPREAAGNAAERHVTIFTVGLGDTEQGARIPVAKDAGGSYLEHDGKQVWSKLDSKLLGEIAVGTGGVYIPAGTRAYNLGELYEQHLQNLRAAKSAEQRKATYTERFQWFLGAAALLFLIELLIAQYALPVAASVAALRTQRPRRRSAVVAGIVLACVAGLQARAAEEKAPPPAEAKSEEKKADAPRVSPRSAVREGLALYSKEQFDAAREKFAQATDALKDAPDSPEAAIAAFDLACAHHRKGELEQAREQYLKAGMARDKQFAANAHYNLGSMLAEHARAEAGEDPAKLAPDGRTKVVEELKEAVMYFRHCLTLQPQHEGARKSIVLIKEWLKFYTDLWRALDREKRRKEANLVEFLDYLIATETALLATTKELKPVSPLDAFAELKRAQDELAEEIEPLKDKIRQQLSPPGQLPGSPAAQPQPGQPDPKQMEEAIKLLTEWSDAAGQRMTASSARLRDRQPAPAAEEQKNATAELEKIWEAVAPFPVLLQRNLRAQTGITETLKPETPEPPQDEKQPKDEKESKLAPPPPSPPKATPEPPALKEEELTELTEAQEKTARRTALMKLKAEKELERVEKAPQPQVQQPPQPQDPNHPVAAQPDPEKVKEGYRKAVELAPKAVEKMNAAAQALHDKKTAAAYPDAEEARKVLEEIAKAQPQNEQQKQDEQKKDEQKQDQQKKDEEQKQDQEKKEQQKKEQAAQDQVEAVLRKVREREKQKRERDEEMKKALMQAAPGADKDW